MVVAEAQLVEWSLPTPEVHSSKPGILPRAINYNFWTVKCGMIKMFWRLVPGHLYCPRVCRLNHKT